MTDQPPPARPDGDALQLGTFECPICAKAFPHEHSQEEIKAFRLRGEIQVRCCPLCDKYPIVNDGYIGDDNSAEILCRPCELALSADDLETAVARWNTRATSPTRDAAEGTGDVRDLLKRQRGVEMSVHMKFKPTPYDLTQPAELIRLLRECRGYLHTCRRDHHGTDFQRREFAMEAIDKICNGEIQVVLASSESGR